MRSQQLKMATI